MDLRRQRIENEWAILAQMMAANEPRIVVHSRGEDEFLLTLQETTAPIFQNNEIKLVSEHGLRFSFARFFPAVPIEAYVTCPIFHPNVHPTTGFVCLWSRFSKTDTVVEALCQLQRILTYLVFSDSLDDVMQPEALAWATSSRGDVTFPLPCTLLAKPPSWPEERDFRNPQGRRRLS